MLTPNTVLGIDASCVLDPSVDLARQGVSPWDNRGAKEYLDALAAADLADVTRETLGDTTPFFTNHTVIEAATGAMTHTTHASIIFTHRTWTPSHLRCANTEH